PIWLIILFLFTQGDALGCYVMPFQGKKVTKKKNTPKSNVRLFGNAPHLRKSQMKNQSMHPGQILKTKFIDPDQIKIKDLAEKLDISTQKLSKIIKGNQSITYDLSLKLADIFYTPPEFWILLQLQYDQSEKSRGTDSPFYQLMNIMGDAMLKLIGVQSNNEYQPRAIVLKEKRLYPDIVAFPKNKDREIVMIEFQGYKEPMMR
ncbi:Addiction module antidote protein, HigA, partial [Candidatus Magnetomorum sp. HK-1]